MGGAGAGAGTAGGEGWGGGAGMSFTSDGLDTTKWSAARRQVNVTWEAEAQSGRHGFSWLTSLPSETFRFSAVLVSPFGVQFALGYSNCPGRQVPPSSVITRPAV